MEKKAKCKMALLLALVIVLQLGYITYVFAFEKEGFHSDEGASYQFANADFERWIYATDDGRVLKNHNKWTDSGVIRDFITVRDGMQFRYDVVAYNMWKDMNPPLHSILLHTVCSFFPETFSWWYAYLINVFAFVAAMVAFYFLMKELVYSDKIALIACAYYGFTPAALNTVIFLRGYALLAAFSIFFLWLHCRMYRRRFQKVYPHLAGVFVVMILGSLTHYTFLMLGLCFTVVFGVYLLCKKRWIMMFLYGEVMALAVVALFFVWPPALDVLAVGNRGLELEQLPFFLELRFSLLYWTREAVGIPFRFPSIVFWAYVGTVLIFVFMFAAAAAFLLRKDERFRAFIKKVPVVLWSRIKKVPRRFRRLDKRYLLCFAVSLGTVVLITCICDMFFMGGYADRYLFFIMPYLIVMFVGVVWWFAKKCTKGKKKTGVILTAVILVAAVCSGYVQTPDNALFKRECEGTPIETLTEKANVILVTGRWPALVYSCMPVRDSANFFAVAVEDCIKEDTLHEMGKLPDDGRPVYLIARRDAFLPEESDKEKIRSGQVMTVDEKMVEKQAGNLIKLSEALQAYSQLTWATMTEEIQEEKSFLGTLCVYQLR